MPDLALSSRRVLTEEGLRPAAVLVEGGRIAGIADLREAALGCPVRDAGDAILMPGLVDSHVHVNEPGRTEWEGFLTATSAAAAGGVTTIVDMPLNSIPATTTRQALAAKVESAHGRLHVDCGFWGGVVPANARNADELHAMVDAGVCGFKAFLVPSGVDEFPCVDESDLRAALPVLAARGVPLLVHAEVELPVARNEEEESDPRRYAAYLASRPPAWENVAIRRLIRLSRETGGAIHVVHLSSAEAVPDLEAGRLEGLRVTAETCPHYLLLAAEDVPDGRTEFKCSPPIRDSANQEGLWAALRAGVIGLVVSDHSPCPPERKGLGSGDFMNAWGGIASLQLRLPAVWTEASGRGFALADLARWMCQRPAELAGLGQRKGRLLPGYDADIVIWNPEADFEVSPDDLHHRHKLTPYAGRRLRGVVETTLVRGRVVFERGTLAEAPLGMPLWRGHA